MLLFLVESRRAIVISICFFTFLVLIAFLFIFAFLFLLLLSASLLLVTLWGSGFVYRGLRWLIEIVIGIFINEILLSQQRPTFINLSLFDFSHLRPGKYIIIYLGRSKIISYELFNQIDSLRLFLDLKFIIFSCTMIILLLGSCRCCSLLILVFLILLLFVLFRSFRPWSILIVLLLLQSSVLCIYFDAYTMVWVCCWFFFVIQKHEIFERFLLMLLDHYLVKSFSHLNSLVTLVQAI